MTNSSSGFFEQNPDVIANRLMQKAHNRDGLPEISIGLAFLTLAATRWVRLVFPRGSLPYTAAIWASALGLPALILSSQWIIKKVRRNFLIEKVGFVQMKLVNRKRSFIVVAVAFVIAFAAAFAAYRFRGSAGWVFLGMGIIGGALMVFRVHLLRYAIGGVVLIAMGTLLAFSKVSLALGLTILYGFAGLLAVISGCVMFILFLRQPAEPVE
jgi:hypothetical protein